jgi:hypothetical protein
MLANGLPLCRRSEGSAGSERGEEAFGTIGLLGNLRIRREILV